MKQAGNITAVLIALSAVAYVMCNDASEEGKTGKAGDHLDLFAVLNLVEKSSSPEALEQSLNNKNAGINNLDLNEDGETDYIRVTDKVAEGAHVLILQVPLASGETQDVAVIEISKTGDQEASLQIVGDEDLYGKDFIVEPKSVENEAALIVATTAVVNVWSWPLVAFVYSPTYVVWESPYYYGYYPVWWEPWPVVAYEVYWPVVSVYHTHYQLSDGYRFTNVHTHYNKHYRSTTHFVYHEKNYGTKNADGKREKDGEGRNVNYKEDDGKKSPAVREKNNRGNDNNRKGSPVKQQQETKQQKDPAGGNNNEKKNSGNKSPQKQDVKQPSSPQPHPKNPSQGGKPGGKGGKHK